MKDYIDDNSYQDKINHEIQIKEIKGSNKILWKVFLNINMHLFLWCVASFHMTTWIYKCVQKVSIIKKLIKLYLIFQTKLPKNSQCVISYTK